jgi:LysR family transcriptional regulator, cys regulon transcriptional activator
VKLQQLRYVVEIVRQGNHLSAAAEAVHTSQPGVSRQIQLLETELGFEIFVRTRNRIIGLTEPGKQVLEVARRVVNDVSALKSLKEEMSASNRGTLTIATTHTLARYILPQAIESFLRKFPDVQLVLKQGDPEQICELVDAGDADLAIGTETEREFAHLVKLPWLDIVRSVVAKKGHPILKVEPLTLQRLAEYPIITYDPRYSGRRKVLSAFKDAGIEPKIVMSAVDADVSKTYVAMGLGIAIMATVSFDPAQDKALGARDASKLFAPSTTYITLRANAYLRSFALQFIRSLSPRLTLNAVRESLRVAAGRGADLAAPAPAKALAVR